MWITFLHGTYIWYHISMTHKCNFELDLDGQVTCTVCGSMDENEPVDIFETQKDFEWFGIYIGFTLC